MNRPDYPTGDPRTAPLVALRRLMPVPEFDREERHLLRLAEIKEAIRK
jgi:hypothetical protein